MEETDDTGTARERIRAALRGEAMTVRDVSQLLRLSERAIETLMTSRPHVLGAVLNRVDIIRNKYYYSRYYGYKYKNYYVRSNAA